MATHSARSLFNLNIKSSEDLLNLYDGIQKLSSSLEISWLLRAVVVFSVAALDAYFHDKIRYRGGKFNLQDMPPSLARFEVPLGGLTKWEGAERKGNVIRNWLTDYFSLRPLQRQEDITNGLKLVGIESMWATIEPDTPKRDAMLDEMKQLVRRRNQIAHEGDRGASRKSGKKLRPIRRDEAQGAIDFVKSLVDRIEKAFPN